MLSGLSSSSRHGRPKAGTFAPLAHRFRRRSASTCIWRDERRRRNTTSIARRLSPLLLAGTVSSCSGDEPAGPDIVVVDDLRVTVVVNDRADGISVDLEVRNLRSSARTVRFAGACNPVITVHRTGASNDPPVWRELDWRTQNGSCFSLIRNADLVAGGAIGTRSDLTNQSILGDSLSPGAYRVRIRFSMSEPEAMLEFDGGEVRLER